MSINSYNITKQNIVYGMFNQYIFSEVKNNIDLIERYFVTDSTTMSNTLIRELLGAIRKYELNSIDEPLFRSILANQGKTDQESTSIIREIIKYKMYDNNQIEPIRRYIRGIGNQSLIDIALNRYKNDPEEYIKFLKSNEYKADYSNLMSIVNFDQLDINSIQANSLGGWASSYRFINESYQPTCKYENGQIVMISAAPGCMSGDTEVYLADGTIETLKSLNERNAENITVYSCDPNSREPKVSVAKNCQISKYVNEWYVVEIDGKEFRVTDNHPFMLIDGTFKEAKNLSIGDSLMPFNIEYMDSKETNSSTGKYSRVYTWNKYIKNRKFSHKLTAEYIKIKNPGMYEGKFQAHHNSLLNGKFNRSDNRVESIKLLSDKDHRALHAVHLSKNEDVMKLFLEKGTKTRFTSEYIRNKNIQNWSDKDYVEFMKGVSSKSGKTTSKKFNSQSKEFNGSVQKIMSILKYGKYLIDKYNYKTTDDLLNNWDNNRILSDSPKIYSISPRTPKVKSVKRYLGSKINDLYDLSLSYNNHEVTNIKVEKLDTPEPVYDLVSVDIYHNYAVKCGENSGFFSHNTGKTLFMMGECLNMTMAGARCHYIALGDMNQKDFVQRMGAMYSGYSFSDSMIQLPNIFMNLKKVMGGRFGLTILPAAQVTVDQYMEYILQKANDFDVFFIDYDSNFRPTQADNMYKEGGYIYDNLTRLSGMGKLVFVAAQPKINVWKDEVIPLEAIGESSRKQHSCDMILTIGKAGGGVQNPNHLGRMKIVKNRRGEEGVEVPYIRLNNGRFKILSESLYSKLKGISDKRNFTDGDINSMESEELRQRQRMTNQVF